MNRVSDDLLASMLNEAANEDWDDLVLALTELQSRRALEPQQEEAVAGEIGECRYCANTGWFYGDPDLDTYCGCAFGKLREELSAHPTRAQKVHESQTVSVTKDV